MNLVVGIVGSLGCWLVGAQGLAASGAIARWLVSIGGAAVQIALLKVLNILK